MLLRRHHPQLEDQTSEPLPSFAHLDGPTVSLLAWLRVARVEFVLVGPVAVAIRGSDPPLGPVSVVPAPYRRNFERLAELLSGEQVRARVDGGGSGSGASLRLGAAQLARGQLRTLVVGGRELDIEGSAAGMPSYQELLYEAQRFEVASGVSVEVASAEDIERYDHLRRTGMAPEIKITRADRPGPGDGAPAPTEAQPHG